ncbi:MAG: hypothetical protein ACI3XA_06775 [Clostridia bacterium]
MKIGDTVYLLGRFGFSFEHKVYIIKVKIVDIVHGRFYAVSESGSWTFNRKDIGKAVFENEEDAVKELEARNDRA